MATRDKRLADLARAAVAGAAQGVAGSASQSVAVAKSMQVELRHLQKRLADAERELGKVTEERDQARAAAQRLLSRLKDQSGSKQAGAVSAAGYDPARLVYDDQMQSVIGSVVSKAVKFVIMVSPYVELWPALETKLKAARKRGVKLILVCRQGDVDEDVISGCKLLFDDVTALERLHTKCFINEQLAFVSTMNLTRASLGNHELGVLLTRTHPEYARLGEIVREYAASSEGEIVTKPPRSRGRQSRTSRQQKPQGCCVRCKESIERNVKRPLCSSCYATWSEFQNPHYEENHCHSCGKSAVTSFSKPLCGACYRKSAH